MILTYIGYLVGQHEDVLLGAIDEQVERYLGRVLIYLVPALALLATGYIVWYRARRRRAGQGQGAA